MDDLKTWLNTNGKYLDGVNLFVKYCPGHQLVPLFTTEHETQFKAKKLRVELLQLWQNISAKQTAAPKPANTAPVHVSGENKKQPVGQAFQPKMLGRWSHPDAQDAIEKQLHEKWHVLFLEKTNLQSRIYDVAVDGKNNPDKKIEAGQMAHRILDLDYTIRNIYKQRDQYFLDGALPAEPQPFEYAVDPIIALTKLKNHERYVREFKKRLVKNPDDKSAQEFLGKHQAAVEHYKIFLKLK